MIVFDIETGPLPEENLRKMLPHFDESSFLVGEFDEKSVRVGNMKDPAKIKEKIDAARAAHEEKKRNSEETLAEAREKHWLSFKADAALSPVTGCVICVSYCDSSSGEVEIDGNGSEVNIIKRFWESFVDCKRSNSRLVGLNIFDFDLPFLVRRSWILGVQVPSVYEWWKHRLNWSEVFLDLRALWLLGQYGGQAKSNFETLASAFGTDGKPDSTTGADFARLWSEDREAAIAYATGDVVQPVVWMEKMGLPLGQAAKAAKRTYTKRQVASPAKERIEF